MSWIEGTAHRCLRELPEKWHPAAVGLLVSALVAMLRWAGAMQGAELAVYDATVRAARSPAAAAPIVLVEETERDLRRWGHPMPDATLARLLRTIATGAPVAIGVDKYRDMPVPPGTEQLEALLRTDARVLWITKFGGRDGDDIEAPAPLRGSDRVGFNDVVDDPGGIVRRGLLFVDDGQRLFTSFGLLLAQRYLEPRRLAIASAQGDTERVAIGRATLRAFEASDGGYSRADAGGFQFLIDFAHAPARFEVHSVSEVLEGTVPAGAFAGKVVIVGSSATSLADYVYTPLSAGEEEHQRLGGAALQAVMVAQLIRAGEQGSQAFVAVLHDGIEYALIAVLALIGAQLGAWGHSPWRFSAALSLGIIAIAGLAVVALSRNFWWPPLPGAAAYVMAASGCAALRAYREKKDRASLMQLFSRHVSSSVAESLWSERAAFMSGGRARPQTLTATVLFTDIRGFSAISERMSAAELLDWLNAYMERMAQLVHDNGGIVDKYIGDAIMAVFGVPVARTDPADVAEDAYRAVRCAWQMGQALEGLNRDFAARGLPCVGMRAGLSTGALVSGSIGSSARLEYTVIGDTVNTASRLESYGGALDESPCRILISGATLERVRERVHASPLGEIQLKGKAEKVAVYRVTKIA